MLDPFFGTGTTGAVAKRLGRRFIGIERDAGYAAAARERIAEVETLSQAALLVAPTKRAEPRVPFLSVIEAGLVRPGETLCDERGRFKATVRPDGQLDNGLVIGSIHKIGALVQGLPACNGWTFWHAERGRRRVVIDEFRAQIRSTMGGA